MRLLGFVAVALLLLVVTACDPVNYTADPSYGSGGIVTLPGFSADSNIWRHALALTADRSVIVTSSIGGRPGLVKVARDGKLDAVFAAHVPPITQSITAITVDASGRVLLQEITGGGIGVTRLQPNGTLDMSFGTGGSVTLAHPALSNFDIAVDHAGRIVLMFDTPVDSAPYNACAVQRLTASGAIDATFAQGAPVIVPFVHPQGSATDMYCPRMLVRSDNSVSVVEAVSGVITLAATGSVDTGYSTGGSTFAARGEITDAALLPGDAIALGGTEYNWLGFRMALGRLLPDGNLDPGFATGGIDAIGFLDLHPECTTGGENDDRLAWLSATPAGNVVEVGENCAGLAVARWTKTGRDTRLTGDGRLLIKNPQANPNGVGRPTAGAVASDGSLVTALDFGKLMWFVGAAHASAFEPLRQLGSR